MPGPLPPGKPPEKVKDFRATMRRLLSIFGKFKIYIIGVLFFAVGSCVFSAIGPRVLSFATTELFEGAAAKAQGSGSIDFYFIAQVIASSFCLYMVSAGCSFGQGWLMTRVSQDICYGLRGEIVAKINRLPYSHFDRVSKGDTLSRITNDVDTLGQSLNQGVSQIITSAVTVLGVLVMMFSINVPMTIIVLVIIPISAVLARLIVRISQKYFVAQQHLLGKVNAQVEETVSGHTEMVAFNQQEQTFDKFAETNEQLCEAAWKSQFVSGVMKPSMDIVKNGSYVLVAIVGCAFAARGTITVGDIQAFIQYVNNFTQPISQLAQVSNVLQQLAAAAERIFEFLDEPEEDDAVCGIEDEVDAACGGNKGALDSASKGEIWGEVCANGMENGVACETSMENGDARAACCGESDTGEANRELQGDIEFIDVCFAYGGAGIAGVNVAGERVAGDATASVEGECTAGEHSAGVAISEQALVIKHFTAHIERGQTVALVGPTGAGKTTIVKLLMRFYDVTSGQICINGKNIRDINRHTLRQNVGMVLQDTWLFHGTIRENIRYGRLQASDAEVERAARAGCAHDFISCLPGGYDFVINEEANNISAGQAQLLTISRAILANRDMLILDEATSNVDTHTEARIQLAMDNLMQGKTCFVIAHRLSTIKDADVLLVMRNGEIVERGTHNDLLASGGFYAQLYNSQFEDSKNAL